MNKLRQPIKIVFCYRLLWENGRGQNVYGVTAYACFTDYAVLMAETLESLYRLHPNGRGEGVDACLDTIRQLLKESQMEVLNIIDSFYLEGV